MHESLRQAAALLQGGERLSALGEVLAKALASIQSDPDSVEAVWHPVGGFAFFKLYDEPSVTLRLHAWTRLRGRFDRVAWPVIHSHDWELTSYILSGEINNSIYVVQPDSEAPTHRIYDVEHQGGLDTLRATDLLVHCRLEALEVLRRGGTYGLDPGVFHSTETAEQDVVATLVLARQASHIAPKVLGEIGGAGVYTMTRHRCSPAEVRQILSLVLEALG